MSATPEERAVIDAAETLLDRMTDSERDPMFKVVHYSYANDLAVALRATRGPTPDDTYTALEAEGWGVSSLGYNLRCGRVEVSQADHAVFVWGIHGDNTIRFANCPDMGSAVRLARQLARLLEQP